MNQIYWNQLRKQRGCEKLKITSGQWAYIKRIGSILNRLYTESCNGDGPNHEGYPKLEENYEARAKKFATDNKLYIYLQSDPRGATIYLDKKTIQDNSYTNAVCIY